MKDENKLVSNNIVLCEPTCEILHYLIFPLPFDIDIENL